jgi:hypothetical protein
MLTDPWDFFPAFSIVSYTSCVTRWYVTTVIHCARQCHGSCGKSPASHRGGPGSIPGQSMWDFWWKKWHWDRFPLPPKYFDFPRSISFHRCCITWKNEKS